MNLEYRIFGITQSRLYRITLAILTLMGVVSVVAAQGTGGNVICAIVGVFLTVKTTIFILGLLLMILGGALYAGSHVLPGSNKGTAQGYGMGMIMGGVIGVIIALLAPWILGVITGQSNYTANVSQQTSAYGCGF